jgi:hypothetical protein
MTAYLTFTPAFRVGRCLHMGKHHAVVNKELYIVIYFIVILFLTLFSKTSCISQCYIRYFSNTFQ